MSLETDLQNVISSATQLNQTVQGKIDNINTTLNNAVADVDSTLNAAVADASSRVSGILAGPTGRRTSIQSMYIPEAPIRIYGAGIIGNDYDKTIDEDNSVIVAENPHQHVDGFPMADPSIVVNPKQAYREKYGLTGNAGWSPYDNGDSETGNPCFVDLPLFQHGEQLAKVNYANANRVWGDSTAGKQAYLVLRIQVQGSPHRAHRTWIQTSCRHHGGHNGHMYYGQSESNINALNAETGKEYRDRGYVNSHQGRITMEFTENSGLNAPEGSVYRNNGIYLAEAGGYGFMSVASGYGSWIAIPLFRDSQWDTLRVWNWGYGDISLWAAGIAFTDYMPDTPA